MGWDTGEALMGKDISYENGEFVITEICDDEELSERWGELLANWSFMGLGGFIKNITVDPPQKGMWRHLHWGKAIEGSGSWKIKKMEPFGHPENHFGPTKKGEWRWK